MDKTPTPAIETKPNVSMETRKAILVYSASFITVDDSDISLEFPFEDEIVRFRLTFTPQSSSPKDGTDFVIYNSTEDLPGGTDKRGVIDFRNFSSPGAIPATAPMAVYLYPPEKKALYFTYRIENEFMTTPSIPCIRRNVAVSFWLMSHPGEHKNG